MRCRHAPGFTPYCRVRCQPTIALVLLVTLLSWVLGQFGNDAAVYGVAAGAVSGLIGVYTAIYIVELGAIINAQWPSELRAANLWPRRGRQKK